MSENTAPALPGPPETGNHVVDRALADLAGLDRADVAEHHDRLAAVQDVLNQVLEDSRRPEGIPQALRPGQGPSHG